jgi:hypothetical protein
VGDTGIEPVTSSVSGKRATAAPIAQSLKRVQDRGGYGIRTRVYGFAGRCLASRPIHRSHNTDVNRTVSRSPESEDTGPTRADDETRTRDPHLGKVMRYQLRYIRISFRSSPRHLNDFSRSIRRRQNRTRHPGVSPRPSRPMCIPRPASASIESRSRATGCEPHGRLAQLVARFLHTEEVISSSLVSPTRKGPRNVSGAFLRPGP